MAVTRAERSSGVWLDQRFGTPLVVAGRRHIRLIDDAWCNTRGPLARRNEVEFT